MISAKSLRFALLLLLASVSSVAVGQHSEQELLARAASLRENRGTTQPGEREEELLRVVTALADRGTTQSLSLLGGLAKETPTVTTRILLCREWVDVPAYPYPAAARSAAWSIQFRDNRANFVSASRVGNFSWLDEASALDENSAALAAACDALSAIPPSDLRKRRNVAPAAVKTRASQHLLVGMLVALEESPSAEELGWLDDDIAMLFLENRRRLSPAAQEQFLTVARADARLASAAILAASPADSVAVQLRESGASAAQRIAEDKSEACTNDLLAVARNDRESAETRRVAVLALMLQDTAFARAGLLDAAARNELPALLAARVTAMVKP